MCMFLEKSSCGPGARSVNTAFTEAANTAAVDGTAADATTCKTKKLSDMQAGAPSKIRRFRLILSLMLFEMLVY